MSRTANDVEAYLLRLGRPIEPIDGGGFLLTRGEGAPIVVQVAPPLVVLRANVGLAPSANPEAEARVFRHLLERNANDLVHAGYGLDGSTIVLAAALELDNLDWNELEAAIDDIDIALSSQIADIRSLY